MIMRFISDHFCPQCHECKLAEAEKALNYYKALLMKECSDGANDPDWVPAHIRIIKEIKDVTGLTRLAFVGEEFTANCNLAGAVRIYVGEIPRDGVCYLLPDQYEVIDWVRNDLTVRR